jgi:hypothetical protein
MPSTPTINNAGDQQAGTKKPSERAGAASGQQ